MSNIFLSSYSNFRKYKIGMRKYYIYKYISMRLQMLLLHKLCKFKVIIVTTNETKRAIYLYITFYAIMEINDFLPVGVRILGHFPNMYRIFRQYGKQFLFYFPQERTITAGSTIYQGLGLTPGEAEIYTLWIGSCLSYQTVNAFGIHENHCVQSVFQPHVK